MFKLVVFDLDGTLAPVGGPISADDIAKLKKLEDAGVRIAISSGKTLYYLIGMFRQVGLKEPIFIGENGNVIAYNIQLPPNILETVKPAQAYFNMREKIIAQTQQLFGGRFWMQPNEVMLTLFFKDCDTRARLRSYFDSIDCKDIVVYEHIDSFDIVPAFIDKRTSLRALGSDMGMSSEDMVAVGDGVNDIPMLEYCGLSIGIGNLDRHFTDYHFDCIGDVLDFLLQMVENDR